MEVEYKGNGVITFVCNDSEEHNIINAHYDELQASLNAMVARATKEA